MFISPSIANVVTCSGAAPVSSAAPDHAPAPSPSAGDATPVAFVGAQLAQDGSEPSNTRVVHVPAAHAYTMQVQAAAAAPVGTLLPVSMQGPAQVAHSASPTLPGEPSVTAGDKNDDDLAIDRARARAVAAATAVFMNRVRKAMETAVQELYFNLERMANHVLALTQRIPACIPLAFHIPPWFPRQPTLGHKSERCLKRGRPAIKLEPVSPAPPTTTSKHSLPGGQGHNKRTRH